MKFQFAVNLTHKAYDKGQSCFVKSYGLEKFNPKNEMSVTNANRTEKRWKCGRNVRKNKTTNFIQITYFKENTKITQKYSWLSVRGGQ